MNDRRRLPAPSASNQFSAANGSTGAGLHRAPELHLVVALEELPKLFLISESLEDELRLRRWLRTPGARSRLLDAVLDGLDEIAA